MCVVSIQLPDDTSPVAEYRKQSNVAMPSSVPLRDYWLSKNNTPCNVVVTT